MANQFLSLSLFIMLLSFFIILNTMASFDEDKSNPVIKSLSVAFSAREIEENIAQSTISDEVEAMREGSTLDRLQALFESNISNFKMQKNRFGNEMYAWMPLKQFENAILKIEKGRGVDDPFLPVLVSLLQAQDKGIPYRMDILLNIEDNPAELKNIEPERLAILMQKSATLTQILQRAGLPKKLMSAGLDKGTTGYVALAFRPYAPYNPAGEGGKR